MTFSPPATDLSPRELRDARVEASADEGLKRGPATWPPQYPDPFAGAVDEIVETHRSALTAAVLGGAVQHHGALVVRNLLDPSDLDGCIAALHRARDQQTRHFDGQPSDDGWFEPVETGSGMDAAMRKANAEMGVVWLADSPNATVHYIELLRRVGVLDLLADHFGEPALFSLQKSTLRSVEPEERLTTWHQDGAFMGAGIRTMNLWIALTDCGGQVPASGMEMIPRRVDEILDTTEGIVPFAIPFDTVDEIAATTGVANPEFRAGDAVFFDDRFVHRTALGPGLTQTRLALESWFFGASSFADDYTCLLA